jgi:Rieske Fe-S protein
MLEAVAGAWSAGAMPNLVTGTPSQGGDEVSYPVPASDGIFIDRDNEVILARWGSQVMAFALSCPHQRTMLKWSQQDRRFQCPKHKSKYQPSGEFISGRATRNMDRYPIRREGDRVVVSLARPIESDRDSRGWGAAVASL